MAGANTRLRCHCRYELGLILENRRLPTLESLAVKVVLAVHHGDLLLCRQTERSALPDVGQAFTIVDEDEQPEFASRVEAVVTGGRMPIVYGGDWPHDPEDRTLKRNGFRPCADAVRSAVLAAIGEAEES